MKLPTTRALCGLLLAHLVSLPSFCLLPFYPGDTETFSPLGTFFPSLWAPACYKPVLFLKNSSILLPESQFCHSV